MVSDAKTWNPIELASDNTRRWFMPRSFTCHFKFTNGDDIDTLYILNSGYAQEATAM